jgi:PfaB family protein
MIQRSPIAVVGMAGVFPGALDLTAFWDNLVSKVDSAAEVPADRWISPLNVMTNSRPAPDKAYSARACLINGFVLDSSGLNLHPDLIKTLDPLYPLALHAGKTALAHCNIAAIDKNRIGVCLAAIALPTSQSTRLTREMGEFFLEETLFGPRRVNSARPSDFSLRNEALSAKVVSLPAALLAMALGLGGGTFTLDAACASSLYAVKLACDELIAGRADVMLAGGLSRPDALFTQVGFSQLQALSPSGRCAPFDESADGLVVGEGAGVLALKRLDDALRDDDVIYGLIRGIGLSNDIRGNLLAPDSEGQVRAMQKAYAQANWSPTDVDHIECHGAGTPLGDFVELTSLRQLWGQSGWSKNQCAIGSVKSAIGHLLTAAGAAGIIKTLLGFSHKTLPPSLNFTRPPENSPLINGPFRVQTHPGKWQVRDERTPRRAAVSAFGFGGINGHILLEEWTGTSEGRRNGSVLIFPSTKIGKSKRSTVSTRKKPTGSSAPRVAIIGMGAMFGSLLSLRNFQEAVFKGESVIRKRPKNRWRGYDEMVKRQYGLENLFGNYMEEIEVGPGDFHIPPNEIPDILPQQLLMLKVAASAMKDAGLPLRGRRPEMSVVVGIGFDFETTGFHLRWDLFNQVRKWNVDHGLTLSESELEAWRQALTVPCGPPLTAVRTVGNLGSIVASRISREFQFGGPSFSVSNEEASGLTALEIGIRSLQNRETDAVLAGAADLFGDVRNIALENRIRPFSKSNQIRPFDMLADGALPGEGAAALVLMRLDDAIENGHRVYAVIEGIGKASGNAKDSNQSGEAAYIASLNRAIDDAGILPETIGFIETHGSGNPDQDNTERLALNHFFAEPVASGPMCAVGSAKPIIGHAGAAAGLASVVKTALCLYQQIIPPLSNFKQPETRWHADRFYIPRSAHYWLKNADEGPRRALTCTMTTDGNCMHAVLSEHDPPGNRTGDAKTFMQVKQERKRPLGWMPHGLFAVEAADPGELVSKLDALTVFIHDSAIDCRPLEQVAALWHRAHKPNPERNLAAVLVASDCFRVPQKIAEAKTAVLQNKPAAVIGQDGVYYSPNPLGPSAKVAFVYPGSGNHYLGMGREIGVLWPETLRGMGKKTRSLKTQMLPHCYVPWRMDYSDGWEKEAYQDIVSDPLNMIFGQVIHGCLMTQLASGFSIRPSAVIGYSLGQSTGYFALGVWQHREDMLARMLKTDLFKTGLAGHCLCARRAWNIAPDQDVVWCAAVVNRPAIEVGRTIEKFTFARLLIVNTPQQCVIGGRKSDVDQTIAELGCEAVFLDGVVTVHCDAALPAAEEYRALHVFPCNPPKDIRFYSCADGRVHKPTPETAADLILKQTINGFDFTKTINQAYQDGISVFLEMGPHASCTGMIRQILKDRPHLAVSASFRGESEHLTMLKFLGALTAERIPVDLEAIYGDSAFPPGLIAEPVQRKNNVIIVPVGGEKPVFPLPASCVLTPVSQKTADTVSPLSLPTDDVISPKEDVAPSLLPFSDLIAAMPEITAATATAHEAFLSLSTNIEKNYAQAFNLQNRLLGILMANPDLRRQVKSLPEDSTPDDAAPVIDGQPVMFSRRQCLEFAVGSVEKVLGPEFAVVDTYPKRVRLPDEPLMLVDRIVSIEGKKCALGPGRIITEHDVRTGAWYLDGGKAPVCISVEAGQADLFLCSYFGIDHQIKGQRAYRLLDATVEFHQGLPEPGDTLRYDIIIDRFVRQGETWLFFFHFKGYIRDSLLITMTHGCAGFFTDEEVKNSGGILLTPEQKSLVEGKKDPKIKNLTTFAKKTFSDEELVELRKGNAGQCFGPEFEGIAIPESLRLPGGRMKLIDRVIHLDPQGGRFGLGVIRAEADIHPDDWFLTCHFQDDRVMPGTLMYECCAHTLRVFVQQMGWITDIPGACYEPKTGVKAILKCRGPVTPQTQKVHYEVEIKQIGADPEPFAIADAHMFADGRYIVFFQDISLTLSRGHLNEIDDFWKKQKARINGTPAALPVVFIREALLEFALGKPSKAFGKPYSVFDQDRFIARLPNPPYLLMDRVVRCEPKPWVLKPDGWIQSEVDVSPDQWYFAANRSHVMPYAILLEIGLQPCGWLAAYMGSALKIDKDLKFRNLGGKAVQHKNIRREKTVLNTRARLKQVSTVADMIIEEFEFIVSDPDGPVFSGDTTFGFFTPDALKQQVGIRDAASRCYSPTNKDRQNSITYAVDLVSPRFPGESDIDPDRVFPGFAAMPAKALLMIDKIQIFPPDCGPSELGFIRGIKQIDIDEWFFKAHFYQDPVCPGSLGVESFIQLLKFAAIKRWKALTNSAGFEMITGTQHQWTYRGQIIPENQRVEVDAAITAIEEKPWPVIMADGFLKVDGRVIYEMKDYGVRLKAEGGG